MSAQNKQPKHILQLREPKSDVVSKDIKTQLKRRISFSGKNSVRVFHGEEEPQTWNNSYEISDHLNSNETVSNTCVPSPCTTIQIALKNTQEIKENVDKFSTTQNSKMDQIENSADLTLYKIEKLFPKEEGKIGEQTNNLCSFSFKDNEKKTHSHTFYEKTIDFVQEFGNATTITGEDVTKTDNFTDEKSVTVSTNYMDEDKCRNPKDETPIYMNDFLSISSNERISGEDKNGANNRKTILQDKTMQFSPNKSKQHNKENVNPFQGQNANKNNIQAMKNTNCDNKEPNIKSRSTINCNEAMEVSPKDTNSLKNTIQSRPTSFFNQPIETSSIYMRSRPTINFNKTIEFSPKNPNKISKEDNVQIDKNSIFFNQTIQVDSQTITDGENNKYVATPKSKSRPTICFNQPIETSPATVKANLPKNTVYLSEDKHIAPEQLSQEPKEILLQPNVCVEKESIAFQEKINRLFLLQESEDAIRARNNTHCDKKESNIKSRSTIYCNEAMEESPKDTNSLKNTIQFCPTSFFNLPIETSSISMRSRPTINFNKTIELSPKYPNNISKEDNVLIDNTKPRTSIYLNQTIKVDSQTVTDQENNKHGVVPKLNSPTNCFHKPMEASPSTVKANLPKKSVHLSEDMHVSPLKLSQESFPSVRKLGQQPKLVTRKICAPLVHKAKDKIDLEQEKMLRYKKKQEQNITSDHAKDNEAVALETDKLTNADQSLNFSLSSVKNMSLSLESSSSLIPSEFKVYNFKQLNDEIECGKINVFSNAPKTPTTDQKARFAASKNVQLTHISSKQRKTQVFDDVDIPVSYNDSLKNYLKTNKSNTYFDFNTTQDIKAQERKNNVKSRYSQADDITLNNTSFLTHAKLSDETVSRNSSNMELTQSEGIMEIIDESLREADPKRKSCNEQNNTLGSMYKNTKPIFEQNITKTKDYNNFINTMDNTNESITDVDNKILHQRRTVVLNHDIETCHNISNNKVEPVENNMETFYNSCAMSYVIDKNEMKNSNHIQKRQTCFLNEDIGNADSTGEILHFENKMPLEKESIGIQQIALDEENALNNAIDKNDTNLSQKRQTLFLNEDIGDETLIDDATRKILYLENKMPLEKESIETQQIALENSSVTIEKDIEANLFDTDERILKSHRKTLYFANDSCELDATLQDNKLCKEVSQNSKNEILNQDMEVTLSGKNSNNSCLQEEQVMDMSIDQYFTPAENEHFIPAETLNAGKISLARQIGTNSFTNKLISKQQLSLITPVKCTDNNTNHRLLCITPRLSDLEFSAEEKKSKEDDEVQCPLQTETNNKRLPVNLTPVLSIPKKRQTLVFDDCLMDESVISLPNQRMSSSKKMESEVEQTRTEKSFHETKRFTCGEEMYISGIVPNESICQTPSEEKKSRIPIPSSSGKKSKKSFSLVDTSSNNHLEAENHLGMEVDNFGESIQLMRRATTATDEKNTSMGHNGSDADLLLVGKPFIFEGNPITISDVSAFYGAQRKSNSVAQQTDMSLADNQIDTSGLNAIEKEKTSSENRYLNLTLEDIDKTRLSLVRLSYEESTDYNKHESALEQENNCTEGQPPPNILQNFVDLKNKLDSVKNLRNASIVYRKCKRSQDTLSNESTSSASGSFLLPEIPPIPDLGLDRLRRLRKRPTIADVNILWQRVSLDRTIVDAHNISDGDEDDETEKSSAVEKFIQKYEQEKKSFEMDLLEKKLKKSSLETLPFVLRLDTLLRTKSPNWIFDYQMQYRGILVFTHKQMLTFSLILAFEEVDPLGQEIRIKSVKLEKGQVPEKNWKAIDFVLDFQLKINLPFDLQSLCKGSNEADVFTMLQLIDKMCLDTVEMGISLQQISFINHASIIRDECRTYVLKNIRQIITSTDSGLKRVDKTEIKVELLNLKKLSFKDIVSPRLYNFREEIHLLPTGLQFLEAFLPNPLSFIKR